MPQAKRKKTLPEANSTPAVELEIRDAATAALSRDANVTSPARALQERLAEEWRPVETNDDGRRWSPRATLALSGGISLLLWGAIGLAIAAVR